jgi:ribosome-associated toxin RatA of RatAB toxin-antitoxin module
MHRQVRVREVVDDVGTKGLEAAFDVEVAPDALLATLWSVAHFPKLFPDVKEARVLRDAGDVLDVEFRIDAVLAQLRYVLRRTLDRTTRTIAWREIGGDLRRVRGSWRVEATDDVGRSRVTYSAFVDPGRFVPTRLVRDLALRKVDEMAERVRRVAIELTK